MKSVFRISFLGGIFFGRALEIAEEFEIFCIEFSIALRRKYRILFSLFILFCILLSQNVEYLRGFSFSASHIFLHKMFFFKIGYISIFKLEIYFIYNKADLLMFTRLSLSHQKEHYETMRLKNMLLCKIYQ